MVRPLGSGAVMRRRAASLLRRAADRLAPPAAPAAVPPAVAAAATATPPTPTPPARPFSPGHDRAEEVFARTLRDHPHLSDRESRLCELVEYFGWEIGQKARYATPWFYEDDPRARRYEDRIGLRGPVYEILHMYSLFNRMDPEREDFFWIYDGVLARLEELGGPDRVSALDFGTGLGQIGLSLAAAGYRTVVSDRVEAFLDFVGWRAANHGLEPVVHRAETEHAYFDTAADGHPFGLVVEWSAFEHVADAIPALETITGGLVPGGLFVTTTFKKDWTPELIEHYRRDSQDDDIADQYFSPEVDAWLDERFEVRSPPRSLAKVLVRRGQRRGRPLSTLDQAGTSSARRASGRPPAA